MNNKVVGIWYSWGDCETPYMIPEDKDAWEYMKELTFKESLVVERENECGCDIYTYPDEESITLHYRDDDTYCYYQIFDSEEDFYSFIYDLILKRK